VAGLLRSLHPDPVGETRAFSLVRVLCRDAALAPSALVVAGLLRSLHPDPVGETRAFSLVLGLCSGEGIYPDRVGTSPSWPLATCEVVIPNGERDLLFVLSLPPPSPVILKPSDEDG
jgi:hypothetical protein